MARTKAAKPEATVIDRGGVITRSNRMFIQLKAIGECNDNGRTVMSIGYQSGKIKAEPNKPIRSLIVPMLMEMLKFAHWTSDEAADADLKVLKAYVDDMEIRKPGQPSLADDAT